MSTNLLVWIILAPLLGAILNGGLYFYNIKKQKISENYFAIIGTLTPLISFLITLSLFLRMIEEKVVVPDVIHSHDWHAGLISLLAKTTYSKRIKTPLTLFTIHNLLFQGNFPASILDSWIGLPMSY